MSTPQFVIEYEERLQASLQLKRELKQLKPMVIQWLSTEPTKCLARGNGKLKVNNTTIRSPLNRQHLHFSLITLLTTNQQMSLENATTFATTAVNYIWQSRPSKQEMRLIRTFNKRKITDSSSSSSSSRILGEEGDSE